MLTTPEPEAETEAYPTGAGVVIVGGIHVQRGYHGVIVGGTRCYVDVYVPRERQQVRVRKTLVQVETSGKQRPRGNGEDERQGEKEVKPVMSVVKIVILVNVTKLEKRCGKEKK